MPISGDCIDCLYFYFAFNGVYLCYVGTYRAVSGIPNDPSRLLSLYNISGLLVDSYRGNDVKISTLCLYFFSSLRIFGSNDFRCVVILLSMFKVDDSLFNSIQFINT